MTATITMSDDDLTTYTDAIGYQAHADNNETREDYFKRVLRQNIALVLSNVVSAKIMQAARVAAEAQAAPDVTVE